MGYWACRPRGRSPARARAAPVAVAVAVVVVVATSREADAVAEARDDGMLVVEWVAALELAEDAELRAHGDCFVYPGWKPSGATCDQHHLMQRLSDEMDVMLLRQQQAVQQSQQAAARQQSSVGSSSVGSSSVGR